MLKILILEDNVDKLRKITQILKEIPEIDITKISSATNSNEVKIILSKSNVDLLILDLAVPPRLDREIEADEGIKLLQELVTGKKRFNLPEHIIGITAFEEIYKDSDKLFTQYCKTLIYYDPTTDEWSEQLKNGVKQIVQSKCDLAPDSNEYQSKLAVICALDKPELSEVLDIKWHWEDLQVPNDATRYYKGHFFKGEEKCLVYAAAASRMGMVATSILAMKMINNFRPEYLGMAGITAGVQGKTNYGDIIAAGTSWDWGSGKWSIDKNKKIKFLPSPHFLPLSVDLDNKFRRMEKDEHTFFNIKKAWKGDIPNHELKFLKGPVASGAYVIADGQTINQIRDQHRELLGVEMETYSVFAAASEAKHPRPVPFSLKSVVDFGDIEKNDQYQKYAAYTSAQALKLFMEDYL